MRVRERVCVHRRCVCVGVRRCARVCACVCVCRRGRRLGAITPQTAGEQPPSRLQGAQGYSTVLRGTQRYSTVVQGAPRYYRVLKGPTGYYRVLYSVARTSAALEYSDRGTHQRGCGAVGVLESTMREGGERGRRASHTREHRPEPQSRRLFFGKHLYRLRIQ